MKSTDREYRMEKHSLSVAGHRTSVTLERAFWNELRSLARRRKMSVSEIVKEIDRDRSEATPPPNLSSAIRVYLLKALAKDGE